MAQGRPVASEPWRLSVLHRRATCSARFNLPRAAEQCQRIDTCVQRPAEFKELRRNECIGFSAPTARAGVPRACLDGPGAVPCSMPIYKRAQNPSTQTPSAPSAAGVDTLVQWQHQSLWVSCAEGPYLVHRNARARVEVNPRLPLDFTSYSESHSWSARD